MSVVSSGRMVVGDVYCGSDGQNSEESIYGIGSSHD